jgi:Kae1-associated kinase Bud32
MYNPDRERYEILKKINHWGIRDKLQLGQRIKKRLVNEVQILKILNDLGFTPKLYFDKLEEFWFTMQYINGGLLEDVYNKRRYEGTVDNIDKNLLFLSLSACLNQVHKKGIIHRDLTPRNIILFDEKQVYLIDFGISRFIYPQNSNKSYISVGTLCWMSPEQRYGQSEGIASDIFQMGLLLYYIFTARSLFSTDNDFLLYVKGWKKLDLLIDKRLKPIIKKACRVKPQKRFSCIDEMCLEFKKRMGLELGCKSKKKSQFKKSNRKYVNKNKDISKFFDKINEYVYLQSIVIVIVFYVILFLFLL